MYCILGSTIIYNGRSQRRRNQNTPTSLRVVRAKPLLPHSAAFDTGHRVQHGVSPQFNAPDLISAVVLTKPFFVSVLLHFLSLITVVIQ
jgi:hypothetical protein